MRRRALRALAALLGGWLLQGAAGAETTGGIEGVVRDTTGGWIASADLLVTSPNLQGARTVRTGRDGRFWLPALPPGVYTVTAAQAGFRPVTKTAIVSLDARSAVDFVLEPAVEEAVSVSGAAPAVDFTSAEGGTTYTSAVVAKLPTARNYADVARANPGVSTDRGDTQGRGISITVYGATSAENQWIIDGVNTTNVFKGQQGKALSSEFVQEVEVKTDGYSAEYGRAIGGVVNVVTKSGGNAFHGDGFVYFDSDATFAQQTFTSQDETEKDMRVAGYHRVDTGVDLGGYLVKDRLWFFGAYNHVALAGDVSRVTPSPLVSTDERFPLDLTDNFYSAKLTWNPGPSTTLVGSLFADPSHKTGAAGADPRDGPADLGVTPIVNPDPGTWDATRRYGGTDFGLRATQLLGSQALISAQFSRHRDRNQLSPVSDAIRIEDWTCANGTPERSCDDLPTTARNAQGGFGWIDGDAANNASHRDQYRADATFYAGDHEVKGGADYQSARSEMTFQCSGTQCVEIHNEYGTTYYRHRFATPSQDDLTVLPEAAFKSRVREAGAYVQDSWRPTGGLTINAGLRWDSEHLQNGDGVTRLRLNNEWQPRLGIVWDPWQDGRTKLYASAGRFYYSMPTAATTWWFSDITGTYVFNRDPTSTIPDPAARGIVDDPLTGKPDTGINNFYSGGNTLVDRNLHGTYQDEFTAGVERLLDPTFTVGLKASYRRLGNTIEDRCDLDYAPGNGGAGCAVVNPGSGEKYASGNFRECDSLTPDCVPNGPATPPGRRLYRGIEVLARKTVGSTLWVQASYVYSSLRGNYDGGVNQDRLATQPGFSADFDLPIYWYNAYGRLYLDRPHHFRLDGYWTTPIGISLGVQAFVESGAPLSKNVWVCDTCLTAYLVPRGDAGRLPTQTDANLSLAYPVRIGPATVTLLAYVYNVLNRQTPTGKDTNWTLAANDGYDVLDPNQPSKNPSYGEITERASPRLFRAAVRVSF
jgi:hypothetical protein